MKQKMQDEVAEAIIAKNGAPLSISEHEAIVSVMKTKAAQAHAEVLESKGMATKGMLFSAPVKFEIFWFQITRVEWVIRLLKFCFLEFCTVGAHLCLTAYTSLFMELLPRACFDAVEIISSTLE